MKKLLTIVFALIGLLTTFNVSAQTDSWSSKVSPLLHQQIVEQQVSARRAPSGEPTETYVGALVKLAEGQNGSVLRREGTILLDSLDGTYIALLPASRIPAMASGEQVVAVRARNRNRTSPIPTMGMATERLMPMPDYWTSWA